MPDEELRQLLRAYLRSRAPEARAAYLAAGVRAGYQAVGDVLLEPSKELSRSLQRKFDEQDARTEEERQAEEGEDYVEPAQRRREGRVYAAVHGVFAAVPIDSEMLYDLCQLAIAHLGDHYGQYLFTPKCFPGKSDEQYSYGLKRVEETLRRHADNLQRLKDSESKPADDWIGSVDLGNDSGNEEVTGEAIVFSGRVELHFQFHDL